MHYWDDYIYLDIIDPMTGKNLPDGEIGEICVKGRIRRALRYKKPAVWVTAAAVVVCAAAAVCLLTNPRDRTPYGWASRVTAGGLNVTYLWEGNSARTPAGMTSLCWRATHIVSLTRGRTPFACKWDGLPESGSFCTAATAGIR